MNCDKKEEKSLFLSVVAGLLLALLLCFALDKSYRLDVEAAKKCSKSNGVILDSRRCFVDGEEIDMDS